MSSWRSQNGLLRMYLLAQGDTGKRITKQFVVLFEVFHSWQICKESLKHKIFFYFLALQTVSAI